MAGRGNPSFLKNQKAQKRASRAAAKRADRAARRAERAAGRDAGTSPEEIAIPVDGETTAETPGTPEAETP